MQKDYILYGSQQLLTMEIKNVRYARTQRRRRTSELSASFNY